MQTQLAIRNRRVGEINYFKDSRDLTAYKCCTSRELRQLWARISQTVAMIAEAQRKGILVAEAAIREVSCDGLEIA